MRHLRALLIRLVGVFRRDDRDFDDELASLLQLHMDDNVRSGRSPAEARRAALLEIGGIEAMKESHRDRRGLPLIDSLLRETRDALRYWRRSPMLAAVALVSLALGIGANTAIFSIVNGLMLRELPVAEPGRLAQILREPGRWSFSNPLWEAIRDRRDLFQGAAAWYPGPFNLSAAGETRSVRGLMVSGDFFDVFGVNPALGRLITSADDRRVPNTTPGVVSGNAFAVISDGFWQREFGGASGVVGATLRINNAPFTIIGVTRPEFFGAEVGRTFDVAIPLAAEPLTRDGSWLDVPSTRWLHVMARLKPNQTIEEATSALVGVQPQLREATLDSQMRPAEVAAYLRAPMALEPASTGVSDMRQTYDRALIVVMVVVGLVLLIACTNLANLLLARADGRRHEMSVRMALGASRGRLVRQLLIESLLIVAAGAGLALAFATWGSRLLLLQISRTPALDAGIDWRVLAFTCVVAIVAVTVFGLAPAWRATRSGAREALRTTDRTTTSRGWLGGVLVAVQVAMSVMLIVGGGLFIRTFVSITSLRLGFDPQPLVVVGMDPGRSTQSQVARLDILVRVRDAVAALPGVANASLSVLTPLAGGWDWLIDNPPGLELPESDRAVYVNAIGPEWFQTYGIRLHSGRAFGADDARAGMPAVTVVNDAFERKYFPGRSAIGQSVRRTSGGGAPSASFQIVGVVSDTVYEFLKNGPPPTIYLPLTSPLAGTTPSLTIRAASGDPIALGPGIVRAAGSIDPSLLLTLRPLVERVDASVSRERLMAMLAGFFGGLALAVAGLGLYGLVSYHVSQRRREIGIRLALGARPREVIGVAVRRTVLVVAIGLVVGTALSAWASRFIAALLFGLEPRDPATLAASVVVLVAVAAIASWAPARRATRLDPTTVLKE